MPAMSVRQPPRSRRGRSRAQGTVSTRAGRSATTWVRALPPRRRSESEPAKSPGTPKARVRSLPSGRR